MLLMYYRAGFPVVPLFLRWSDAALRAILYSTLLVYFPSSPSGAWRAPGVLGGNIVYGFGGWSLPVFSLRVTPSHVFNFSLIRLSCTVVGLNLSPRQSPQMLDFSTRQAVAKPHDSKTKTEDLSSTGLTPSTSSTPAWLKWNITQTSTRASRRKARVLPVAALVDQLWTREPFLLPVYPTLYLSGQRWGHGGAFVSKK